MKRLARGYCLFLGAALLLEGAGLLVGQALNFYVGDVAHNALHAVWGIAILVLWRQKQATLTLIVFGVFYTALAISGVLATNPYGLQLGPGENAFHFIVGPLALVLGLLAQRESSRASISASSAPTSGSTPSA